MMATACNDGYIRLFNLSDSFLMCTLKGVFGAPLCLDVCRSLLVAGFEDDTFIVYHLYFTGTTPSVLSAVQPLLRGIGHKSFVCQVRFDNYLMEFMKEAAAAAANKAGEEEAKVNMSNKNPGIQAMSGIVEKRDQQ